MKPSQVEVGKMVVVGGLEAAPDMIVLQKISKDLFRCVWFDINDHLQTADLCSAVLEVAERGMDQ